MKIIRDIQEMHDYMKSLKTAKRKEPHKIGFVPTMGALHAGHLSLVEIAGKTCDKVVVSIFINPIQFGADEDLDRYPRTLDEDCFALKGAGASAVFTPQADVIYPANFSTSVCVSGITEGLCGEARPGHFDGVTTVCSVLFGIVKPDIAVLGMKDAQQLAVIKRMVQDLRMGIEIIGAPILREADGLAMSSRNRYLSAGEREQACLISAGLKLAKALYERGEKNCEVLKNAFRESLKGALLLRIQYVEIVNPETMIRINEIGNPSLMATAVFVGETRLIDNVLFEPEV